VIQYNIWEFLFIFHNVYIIYYESRARSFMQLHIFFKFLGFLSVFFTNSNSLKLWQFFLKRTVKVLCFQLQYLVRRKSQSIVGAWGDQNLNMCVCVCVCLYCGMWTQLTSCFDGIFKQLHLIFMSVLAFKNKKPSVLNIIVCITYIFKSFFNLKLIILNIIF